MVTWRKTGKNWVKGTIILNITPKYKVNSIVGYYVDKYDFSKRGTLMQQRVSRKLFKTANIARQYVGKYMRKH